MQCMRVCKAGDKDKSECSLPTDCLKKEQARCKPNEKAPHNVCIKSGDQKGMCWPEYTCGVDECSNTYNFDVKCSSCTVGEIIPHYECVFATQKCGLVNTCGKNSCDPYKTERIQVNRGAFLMEEVINSECKRSDPIGGGITNRYICDPNSIKVDSYGQCIVDNYNKYPTAKICDIRNNKSKIDLLPCTIEICDVTPLKIYNTDCVEEIPEAPPPTLASSFTACYISTLRFYDKKNNHEYKDVYSMFSKPDLGILDNPKLEYTAVDCDTCKLTIIPTIANFISTNPNIFGNLMGEPIAGHLGRYLFDKSVFNGESIILNVNELTPGSYTITLECTDPVTRAVETKSLKLNIFPQLR